MNVGELIEYLYQLDPTTLVFASNWLLSEEFCLEVHDYDTYKQQHIEDEPYPPRPACGKILYIG